MSSQLISALQVPSGFINNLIKHPARFYHKSERPKMKFGRQQLDGQMQPKKRITKAPIAFLKVKQREIHNHLQKIILPNCMFGAVKGRNNIMNALQHINSDYFFTVDLRDFFGNIGNKQVNRALRSYGFSWEDARLITKMCTSGRCLPQGAPTSSTLANIVFAPTAELLEIFCAERGITFTVFVDDLTFSSKNDFSACINTLLNIIRQNGFFPNNKKIHYRRRSCEITGLIVKNGKLRLEKEMLNRLDNPGVKAYVKNINRHFLTSTAIHSNNDYLFHH
jgi:RNA-directed DNA polymerase